MPPDDKQESPGFASGGYIGPRPDGVPVWLTRGCAYYTAAQVRAIGPKVLEVLFPNSDVHVIDEETPDAP